MLQNLQSCLLSQGPVVLSLQHAHLQCWSKVAITCPHACFCPGHATIKVLNFYTNISTNKVLTEVFHEIPLISENLSKYICTAHAPNQKRCYYIAFSSQEVLHKP